MAGNIANNEITTMMRNDDDDDDYDDEGSDEDGGDFKLSHSQNPNFKLTEPHLSDFETLKLKLSSCWGHRNVHTQEDDWHNDQMICRNDKMVGTIAR